MLIFTSLRRALQLTLSLLLFALTSSGAAATVVYEFEGTVGSPTQLYGAGGFAYTAPSFILTDFTVPSSALDECHVWPATANCNAVSFLPNYFPGYDAIGFSFLNTGFHLFYFVDGAFSSPGSYGPAITTIGNLGRLVVREVSTVSEPQSFGILALCLAIILFRQLRARSTTPVALSGRL
jgi:hypothetical protein